MKKIKAYGLQIGRGSFLSPRGRKRVKFYLSKRFAQKKAKEWENTREGAKIIPVIITFL